MDKKVVEKDFGGIVKWSVIGNVIYVDPLYKLELKRRLNTPELIQNIKDIINQDEAIIGFFHSHPEMSSQNLEGILEEVPIETVERILKLIIEVELSEEKEDKALNGGKNGQGCCIHSCFY